tara:strand:+ start:882 stop:1040 length:159 start_codon:yes stop_codon:yes gene_type:complete
MKKCLLFYIFLCFTFSWADEVSLEKAEDVATTFITQDLNLINPSLSLVDENS